MKGARKEGMVYYRAARLRVRIRKTKRVMKKNLKSFSRRKWKTDRRTRR